MKVSLKKARRSFALTLVFVMMLSLVQVASLGSVVQTVQAAEQNPLTTVVKTAAIGCEGGSYTLEDGVFNITGAGSQFDKGGTGNDSYYYVYFDVKEGTQTITAKLTPGAANASGMVGVIARNGLEAADEAGGVYYDYGNKQIRGAHHSGAAGFTPDAMTDSVYVKLEFSKGAIYYTVAKDAAFSELLQKRSGMGVATMDARNIGFFATEGNTLTVSDVEIIANYNDGTADVKKIVYSSKYGELIPEFSKSSDYGKPYVASFTQTANGNEWNLVNTRGGSNGKIREGENVDYLLFPATTENWTIRSDVAINNIATNTDRQGVAIGQFATGADGVAIDVLQADKNKTLKHHYAGAGATPNGTGNPMSVSGAITINQGDIYTMVFTKYAADADRPSGYSFMSACDAKGTELVNGEYALSNAGDEPLTSGKQVQYGFAIAAADVTLTNLKIINEAGYVIYDQNDYYIAVGVAPVVGEVKAVASEDRLSINLNWTDATPGVGNAQYIVMVSKDGGAYEQVGTSKIQEFSYNPKSDGSYTFKVYGRSGDSSSEAEAKESNAVSIIIPIDSVKLSAVGTAEGVNLAFDPVAGCTAYDVYRKVTSAGTFEVIATLNASDFAAEITYTDTPDAEVPVYYYVIAKNETNTSNPCETQQALRTAGHTGEYAVGPEADNLTITSKTNDTVFDGKFEVKGTYAVNGSYVVKVNGTAAATVNYTAGTETVISGDLADGRNDVEVIFTNETGKKSRTTFNFVSNPKYDILVDAAYTGAAGAEVDGVPTYASINAALASVASDNASRTTIFVKNGQYKERVVVNVPNVSILGEDSKNTKIQFSAAVAEGTATGMWDRNAMLVDSAASNFTLENIWVENTFNYTNGSNQQADCLAIAADNVVVINVTMMGYQDTLLTASRLKDDSGNYKVIDQYFYKCYITGNVDFVYGDGTSVFEDCDIVGRYTSYKKDGCFTAARTYDYVKYGYVFNNCRFYGEDGIGDGQYRLARPWGADAATVFLNCYMGSVVGDEGYGDMSGNSYKKARFAEYNSYGPAFKVNNDRPLLSTAQAEDYATATVLGADFDYQAVMTSLYTTKKPPVKPENPSPGNPSPGPVVPGEQPEPDPSKGEYIGNINSELVRFELIQNEAGVNFLSGEIIVVEWRDTDGDGVYESTVPEKAPIMKFVTGAGEEIEVYVTPTGTNQYYFDRAIGALEAGKEYKFQISSDDDKNVSIYKSMYVNTLTNNVNKAMNLGRIDGHKIGYRTAADNTMIIKNLDGPYEAVVNSVLTKVECQMSAYGSFVSGNIVVVDWLDNGRYSTVPWEAPKLTLVEKGFDAGLDCYVAALGTNEFYFDRNMSDEFDTTKEYLFKLVSGDPDNVSSLNWMYLTTNYMDLTEGLLWETNTQRIMYKTTPYNGDNVLTVYAENK